MTGRSFLAQYEILDLLRPRRRQPDRRLGEVPLRRVVHVDLEAVVAGLLGVEAGVATPDSKYSPCLFLKALSHWWTGTRRVPCRRARGRSRSGRGRRRAAASLPRSPLPHGAAAVPPPPPRSPRPARRRPTALRPPRRRGAQRRAELLGALRPRLVQLLEREDRARVSCTSTPPSSKRAPPLASAHVASCARASSRRPAPRPRARHRRAACRARRRTSRRGGATAGARRRRRRRNQVGSGARGARAARRWGRRRGGRARGGGRRSGGRTAAGSACRRPAASSPCRAHCARAQTWRGVLRVLRDALQQEPRAQNTRPTLPPRQWTATPAGGGRTRSKRDELRHRRQRVVLDVGAPLLAELSAGYAARRVDVVFLAAWRVSKKRTTSPIGLRKRRRHPVAGTLIAMRRPSTISARSRSKPCSRSTTRRLFSPVIRRAAIPVPRPTFTRPCTTRTVRSHRSAETIPRTARVPRATAMPVVAYSADVARSASAPNAMHPPTSRSNQFHSDDGPQKKRRRSCTAEARGRRRRRGAR